MQSMLELIDQCYKITEGLFDPTIDKLSKLWSLYLKEGKIPSDSDINSIEGVGWNNIQFSNGKFKKHHSNTSIDLGGIAKGYCVDRILERLSESGYSDVFVDWGSEIRTIGQHPDNRDWRVAVMEPPTLGEMFNRWKSEVHPPLSDRIATLDVRNQAIATSGDYMQSKKFGYFHIIHPKTKKALQAGENSIASVSILSPKCAIADAIATAVMCISSIDEAKKFLDNIPEVRSYCLYSRSQSSAVLGKILSTNAGKSIRTSPIKQVMRNIPRPVCIISTITDGKEFAITASSVQDFNAKGKSYIMFNLMKNSLMGAQFVGQLGKKFSINLLNKDQIEVAKSLAIQNSIPKELTQSKVKDFHILEGAVKTIHCVSTQITQAGDHYIVIGIVVEVFVSNSVEALVYHKGEYVSPKYQLRTAPIEMKSLIPVPRPIALITTGQENSSSGYVSLNVQSCSLVPPLLSLVSSEEDRLYSFFGRNNYEYFSVNVLTQSQDTQAIWFADKSANLQELFLYVPTNLKFKVPEILGSLAIFYCKAQQVIPIEGNQKLVVAEIIDQDFSFLEEPLLLHENKFCKSIGK